MSQGSIVAFTGAGVSTESGVPDFRSKGGVWDTFDPMEFHITAFHADPESFWARRARLLAAMDYLDAEPNAAHVALAQAALDDRVATVITQNVDGLHSKAGTPPERLLELHGNGRNTVCMTCRTKEDVHVTLQRLPGTPRCACGGVLKPDVVLFGEPVPAMEPAIAAVRTASVLLVAGTSLNVHPAAGLLDHAIDAGARIVLCNREATPYDHLAARIERTPLTAAIPAILDEIAATA